MPEVAGTIRCPVCGREEQEIRINKNRNLYVYCEGGCRMTYSATTSRKALPVLKSGKVYQYNGYIMRPLTGAAAPIINQPAGTNQAAIQETKQNDGNRGRNTIVGRTNGQSAAADGVLQPTRNRPGGWLASWLGDDDE